MCLFFRVYKNVYVFSKVRYLWDTPGRVYILCSQISRRQTPKILPTPKDLIQLDLTFPFTAENIFFTILLESFFIHLLWYSGTHKTTEYKNHERLNYDFKRT